MENEKIQPLVSIIVATYNGEKYLAQQLESIRQQTYSNIEIIFQDDVSSDSTVAIAKQVADPRIHIRINPSNMGFVRNFEEGLKAAKGDYIALCDQDDIWEANKIERLLEHIGDADLIHSNCSLIDENGQFINRIWKVNERPSSSLAELLFFNKITGCTAIIRRKILLRALPFPDGIAYHDWWLALCAAQGNGVRFLDEALVRYRQHANQDTGANQKAGLCEKIGFVQKGLRRKIAQKQLNNLSSINPSQLDHTEQHILHQAICFHRSLSQGMLHPQAALIYCWQYKNIKPNKGKFSFIDFIKFLYW
ncbi:glycosyltransferase family 2 protein [Aquitalea palustris]|uniref:Glycosyltransferase family 2 protein n=1 Tax=Aquitalea palustris TaxID=2480983 RepID=A0A454JJU9_9NEIS|nr:glycosyltransferase family 2 protein [Aquitalea palustris]RMC99279.1 glycosyltransferase family 2 protein [Aquitalea palustris]